MSYDLIVWRGAPTGRRDARARYASLTTAFTAHGPSHDGTIGDFVDEIAEVADRAFNTQLEVDLGDGYAIVHIPFAQVEELAVTVLKVASEWDLTLYDPQSDAVMVHGPGRLNFRVKQTR